MAVESLHIPPAGGDSSPADIAVAAERVTRITGAVRRDDTITSLDPMATWWRTTWTANDKLLTAVADGVVDRPDDFEAYHNRVFEVVGTPPDIRLERIPGYPNMIMRFHESEFASYWGGSIIAVGQFVYRYLYTSNHPYLREDGSFWPGFVDYAAKLIYSPDNGETWHNQDGSTPVVWENWDARTPANMMLIDEEHRGLNSGGVFLQMGQAYSLNTDGYVYAYFGMSDGADLGLYRVPRDRVLERSAIEFYTGRLADGTATWSFDAGASVPLHTFPPGWVSTKDDDGMTPTGWSATVTYNPALGVYLLAGQGVGVNDEGGWWAKPSYLGLWAGPTPWGPFTQFHEDTAWAPAGNTGARAFGPQIVPKWISEDGRSFWMVWSDIEFLGDNGENYNPDAAILRDGKHLRDDAEFIRFFADWSKKHNPGAYFNMQLVELEVE